MRISSVVLLVCCLLAGRSMGQQVDCGSDQVMTKLSRQYPSVQTAVQSHGMHLWQLMRDFRTSRPDRSSQNIVIPVVFHVIHDNGVENINEAQIRDALRILNEDFSAMNNELGSIASAFTGIVDAPGVEFRLAELDPDGYPTTGITRTWSLMTYNGFDFNIQSSLIRWPRDRYLNVWVVKYIPGPLGFAFLPQTTDDPETAIYDGIVVRHNALGTFGTATGKISKVLSHEVGHWLGLLHTFGTAVNGTYQQHCVIGDYVDDTPPTRGNPGHCDTAAVSCGNLDNVQNFMDYSKCPSMFTIGQTEVMLAVLNSNLSDRSTVWKDSSLLTTLIGDSILPRMVYTSTTFFESTANNGAVRNSIDVSLIDELFDETIDTMQPNVHYTATGLPSGLSPLLIAEDTSHLVIRLLGTSVDHRRNNSVSSIRFTFLDAAFRNKNAQDLLNPVSPEMELQFLDPYAIQFVDLVPDETMTGLFYRSPALSLVSDRQDFVMSTFGLTQDYNLSTNLGNELLVRSGQYIKMLDKYQHVETALPSDSFLSGTMRVIDDDNIEWQGNTGYVGFKTIVNGVTNYGWLRMRVHPNRNNFQVLDMAYQPTPGEVLLTGEVDAPVIALSGNVLREDTSNRGYFSDSIELTLFGENSFSNPGATLQYGRDYEIQGLPTGLAPSIAIAARDDRKAVVSFAGRAVHHSSLHNMEPAEIRFYRSAFNYNVQADVVNPQIPVSFKFIYNEGVDFVPVAYPNPSTGNFTVRLPDFLEYEMRMMDVAGKIVIRDKVSGPEVQISERCLQTGLYVLEFYSWKHAHRVKVMIR